MGLCPCKADNKRIGIDCAVGIHAGQYHGQPGDRQAAEGEGRMIANLLLLVILVTVAIRKTVETIRDATRYNAGER